MARTTPGYVTLAIEGTDEATVYAMAWQLANCYNLTGPSTPWRVPDQDGVRIRATGYLEPTASDS
ncbi:DUF6207 family protein [Streptomyces fractus]|uniref:DUF6207 family protein n=1 Tax=Streptomyces fractus TaxID=641806 RepID=UPI003CE965B3